MSPSNAPGIWFLSFFLSSFLVPSIRHTLLPSFVRSITPSFNCSFVRYAFVCSFVRRCNRSFVRSLFNRLFDCSISSLRAGSPLSHAREWEAKRSGWKESGEEAPLSRLAASPLDFALARALVLQHEPSRRLFDHPFNRSFVRCCSEIRRC